MAGHMTVGVRRSDGREYWMCIHARDLDYKIHDPEFQREGGAADSFIEAAHKDDWVASMMKSPYKNYGYGGLVVDFKEGIIMSRQGYCSMDPILVSGNRGLETFAAMQDAGDIKEILKGHPEDLMSADLNYDEAMSLLADKPYEYIYVKGCGPLCVDHDHQISDAEGFREVKKWAKAHGWKLKSEREK